MGNKDIQRERIKTYFIEAAKEIVLEEGIEGISARKIADRAGYCYATIYNYFKDMDHLLWCLGFEFTNELYKIIEKKYNDNTDSETKIINIVKTYIDYFIKYPNVFEVVFMKKTDQATEELKYKLKENRIFKILSKCIKECSNENKILEKDIEILTYTIVGSVHGLMMFYFSNNQLISKEQLYEKSSEIIHFNIHRQREVQ